jgi:hypothetical protein
MIVYQLMPAAYALEDLRRRRVKVSRLEDLNDPFELLGGRLERSGHRAQMREWRQYMSRISRLLCFSRRYMNPVLWSHYADKHRGMALAFDIPANLLHDVLYAPDRLEIDFEAEAKSSGGVSPVTVQRLLTTKFADWQYEDELRMFVRPEEVTRYAELEFMPFGPDLKLAAVYVGSRCGATLSDVRNALQPEDSSVEVHATRLAFRSYRVIRTPWRGS